MIKKILYTIVIILIIAQFIRINKTNPPVMPQNDFIALHASQNPQIATLINRSCADCHSNQTQYPWYTNIAPISWWIKHHLNEGRQELNFSEWATYKDKRKKHKIEECIEQIEKNEMPLNSYIWMHPEAKLNPQEKETLITYFKNFLNTFTETEPNPTK